MEISIGFLRLIDQCIELLAVDWVVISSECPRSLREAHNGESVGGLSPAFPL